MYLVKSSNLWLRWELLIFRTPPSTSKSLSLLWPSSKAFLFCYLHFYGKHSKIFTSPIFLQWMWKKLSTTLHWVNWQLAASMHVNSIFALSLIFYWDDRNLVTFMREFFSNHALENFGKYVWLNWSHQRILHTALFWVFFVNSLTN